MFLDSFTIPTLFVVGVAFSLSACRANDPRFDNAPTISAHDVTSHNTQRLAPPQPEPQIPDEPTAAPIPKSGTNSVGSGGRQPLPVDHVPIGEGGSEPLPMPGNSVQPDANAIGYASTADYGKTGPLRWDAPEDWKATKPENSFRIAEYVIPGKNGTHSATMSIFHFPGGGGGIKANISRWLSQFTPPEGAPPQEDTTRTLTVAGLKVWRVEAKGVFNPGMSGGPSGIREDYALEGAIVETSAGPFFFKLVGPRPTIEGSRADFDKFVSSFHAASSPAPQ